jgi:hypothetical protein
MYNWLIMLGVIDGFTNGWLLIILHDRINIQHEMLLMLMSSARARAECEGAAVKLQEMDWIFLKFIREIVN